MDYYTSRKIEHEGIKKLARELRKLIPNHKFRAERGFNNGIVIDEKTSFYKNCGETFEDLKGAIVSYCQKEI